MDGQTGQHKTPVSAVVEVHVENVRIQTDKRRFPFSKDFSHFEKDIKQIVDEQTGPHNTPNGREDGSIRCS